MEIKSSLINSKELKLLKDSLIAASEVDGKENFRVRLIEYIDDTADNEEDEFFYDMMEFCRFLKPDLKTTAYTTPDHIIYLNAPGVFGEKVREWDFIYCHECLHQLWDTFNVGEQIKKNGIKFDHYVLNVASDCVINDYLSAIRKKTAPPQGITPEYLKETFGVEYDRKVDTQFTLYLKLLEVAEKLRKDKKCQDSQDDGDGQEEQGGSSSGSSSSRSSSSNSGSSSSKNDSQSNTAEGAQKSANEAKKAADKAQQNADSGKGSQKDANTAKEAANEAQDAADRAKDAANKGDKEGEAKAAKEAKDAANRAKELAGEGSKDGNNTAEGAQKSADEAKNAANKAQQNADSGKGSQKDANAAKEAANEAQDAADRAKDAANNGDKEGEAKAAQEAKAAANKAKELAGEGGKDGDNTAEGAQKSADEAKKAADKAQQNADSGKGSQKDADAAKDAAKEAQDAADRAKDAANKGDKEGEAKAAQEAKDAADKAKKLAGEDNTDRTDGNGKGSEDKTQDGKGQGHYSPEGVGISGELTEEEKAQIKAKAEGVIKRYKDKITGVFGDFVKKCRNSVKCDPNGLANNTRKGKGAWNKQMDVAINAYVKKNLDKKRRQFEQTYKRVKRGSGIVKMGTPIIPGKRIKDDKMPINIAYYIDRSGSMEACIDEVFKAAFKISEALNQRFRKDKLVKSIDFRTFVFNTHMDEIKFGQTTYASGGTMGLDQILEFINKNTKNVLINIIITDAGFIVNEKEIKDFLKTGVDGLVIFITNTENTEVKKIADEPEFKTKLIYILADAEFNVE